MTMQEFYIKEIYVYFNYASKNIPIDMSPKNNEKYRHLVLTGKNGSGKSTTIGAIYRELLNLNSGFKSEQEYFSLKRKKTKQSDIIRTIDNLGYSFPKVELDYSIDYNQIEDKTDTLVINIPAYRKIAFNKASENTPVNLKGIVNDQNKIKNQLIQQNQNAAVLKNQILNLNNKINKLRRTLNENRNSIEKLIKDPKNKEQIKNINTKNDALKIEIDKQKKQIEDFKRGIIKIDEERQTYQQINLNPFFEQFLVDRIKQLAYAIADRDVALSRTLKRWFVELEQTFRYLFEEPKLKLKHELKSSSFHFVFPKNRRVDFNLLADGYGSVLYILSEILLQQEAFKERVSQTNDPTGIVLIDEIEAHLHISLQEKILPTLIKFFPNLQFIVGTHSPQVIASVSNTNVYDLTSGKLITADLGGISYDVISKSHFGIPSEYSIRATELLVRAKELLSKNKLGEKEEKELRTISDKLSELSPELIHEIYLYFKSKRK